MATRRSATRTRRGGNAGTRIADPVYGLRVPEALHEAIEDERSNLSRAESVLGCLAIAMENQADVVNGPYYPDVAQLARELVRRSINGLDSLALQRHLLKDKVKEGCYLPGSHGAYAAVSRAILPECSFGPNEELRLRLPMVIHALDQRRTAAPE